MRKERLGRLGALAMAVVILGLVLVRTATASHTTGHVAFSGGSGFRGLVVKTERNVVDVTAVEESSWQTIDSRGFQIPAGESQLVVVDFFATTECLGSSAGFCNGRALIGASSATAQLLEPAVPAPLDQVGADGREAHALSWALCVGNSGTSPLSVSVWLQAANSNSAVSLFRLHVRTLKISRYAPCSPAVDL